MVQNKTNKMMDLLKEKGIILKLLAKDMGISRQHLYNKINGVFDWKFHEILIISEKTKIPLSEFKNIVIKDRF